MTGEDPQYYVCIFSHDIHSYNIINLKRIGRNTVFKKTSTFFALIFGDSTHYITFATGKSYTTSSY